MLTRAELLLTLEPVIRRSIVVAALGNASRELYARFDHGRTFYLLGSMGMPISVGLGIAARAQDDVVVIEGDGGLLMNLGALATAARYGRANLKIVVVDNESYESTGAQPSSTAHGVALDVVARGCGIDRVRRVESANDLSDLVEWLAHPGMALVVAKVAISDLKSPRVALTPPEIFSRLQNNIAKESRRAN